MTAPDNVVLLDIPRILESCVVHHLDDGTARWYLYTAIDGNLERFCGLHMGSTETICRRRNGWIADWAFDIVQSERARIACWFLKPSVCNCWTVHDPSVRPASSDGRSRFDRRAGAGESRYPDECMGKSLDRFWIGVWLFFGGAPLRRIRADPLCNCRISAHSLGVHNMLGRTRSSILGEPATRVWFCQTLSRDQADLQSAIACLDGMVPILVLWFDIYRRWREGSFGSIIFESWKLWNVPLRAGGSLLQHCSSARAVAVYLRQRIWNRSHKTKAPRHIVDEWTSLVLDHYGLRVDHGW